MLKNTKRVMARLRRRIKESHSMVGRPYDDPGNAARVEEDALNEIQDELERLGRKAGEE